MNLLEEKNENKLIEIDQLSEKEKHNFFLMKKKYKLITKENIKEDKFYTTKNPKNVLNIKSSKADKIIKLNRNFNSSIYSNAFSTLPSVENKKKMMMPKMKSVDQSFKKKSFLNNSLLNNTKPNFEKFSDLFMRKSFIKEKSKNKSLTEKNNHKNEIFFENKYLWQTHIKNISKKKSFSKDKKEKKRISKRNSELKQKLPRVSNHKKNMNLIFAEFDSNYGDLSFKFQSKKFLKSQFPEILSVYSRFKNLKEIGKGSYAVAFKAFCRKSQETIVLKTFKLDNFIKKTHLTRLMVNIIINFLLNK